MEDLVQYNFWRKALSSFKDKLAVWCYIRNFLVFGIFCVQLLSCDIQNRYGSLTIKADFEGSVELFHLSKLNPMQLESEQALSFNQSIQLRNGPYLLLGDCSYSLIRIKPGQHQEIRVYSLKFHPPMKGDAEDTFPFQCSRFEKSRSRQLSTNQFEFSILEGKWELLSGLRSLNIDFTGEVGDEKRNFYLGAIRVESSQVSNISEQRFFVSSMDQKIAATHSQIFNHWVFVPEGNYKLEANGTEMNLQIKAGEKKSVIASSIKILPPDGVDLAEYSKKIGSPALIEINKNHWLSVGDLYLVLPGLQKFRLANSQKIFEEHIEEGSSFQKKLHAVQVDQKCEENDWTCLGRKKIQLFDEGNFYPFAEGISDGPLLYWQDFAYLGVAGSRDIRTKVGFTTKLQRFKMGELIIKPQFTHKNFVKTDLMRVIALSAGIFGKTLDLSLEGESKVSLLEGSYRLEVFVSSTHSESGDRYKQTYDFHIESGKETILNPTLFSGERKAVSIRK